MKAKTLVLAAFGAASVGFSVAAQPRFGLGVRRVVPDPTSAVRGPIRTRRTRLYFVNHPPPVAPAPFDPGYQQPTVFNPGGILSGVYSNAGLCELGDDVCPAPVSAAPPPQNRYLPRHHRKHHRAE